MRRGNVGMLCIVAISMGAAPAGRRPVVVTTDCGCSQDDQWAIVHLALSPEIDLQGIVTTHAPNLEAPASESSARAVRDVLSRLPAGASSRPPVLAGSGIPLADRSRPLENEGVAFLLERAKGHSAGDRLTVVALGAATDLASALLIDPSWADRVEEAVRGLGRGAPGLRGAAAVG
jgi:purine nucleosidase